MHWKPKDSRFAHFPVHANYEGEGYKHRNDSRLNKAEMILTLISLFIKTTGSTDVYAA